MADDEVIELAEQITELKNRLNELWQETEDPKQKKKVRRQLDDLDLEIMRLISIHIKASGKEYDQAVEAITEANAKIQEAIDDLNTFVEALEFTAAAVDLISKVKPV